MSGGFFVFFHSLLRRYVFFSISALGTALSLPFPKKSPSCRMWYCRFTVCNDCDPRRAAPACTRSRSGTLGSLAGMSGAGLGIFPAWAGLLWDTGVHPCYGLFCVKCHMSAGERKNRESHLDPLALQNECYQLKEFQFLECLWGGCGGLRDRAVSLGDTSQAMHSRVGDSGQVPVLCSASEATHPTSPDADWRTLGCLADFFGGGLCWWHSCCEAPELTEGFWRWWGYGT